MPRFKKPAFPGSAMPAKTHVSFKNHERQMKMPFIIYAHFEALQLPKPKTKSTLVHTPCGFGYSVKCTFDDSLSTYDEYCGENAGQVFWEKLQSEVSQLQAHLSRTTPSPQFLNDEEIRLLDKLTTCYFCGEEMGNDRTKDFHPLTGEFLGVAHQACKQRKKIPNVVPVVMHNFAKYGSHFLLEHLDGAELNRIFFPGNDKEGKFGFSRKLGPHTVRFIDSKLFMDETIEDLEKILADSKKSRLKKEFRKKAQFDLVKTKSYFPHCHVDSFEKFSSEELPERDQFLDRLHDQEMSEEEYQRFRNIWTSFECQTLRDYFSVYAKSSVFLLEDIFENFRLMCLAKYGLDPAYYYTVAGFAWDAMLKFTKVRLELLQDRSMIAFIKSNIRGGIVQCSKRHAKANNRFCNTFDDSKPPTFIAYLDANNLGGWAMSQPLPFSHFRWLDRKEIDELEARIPQLPEDGDYGYFLEVDLLYPEQLHRLHNDLPFCSHPMAVPPPSGTQIKPVLTFFPKSKYVIDYRTLKQCLSHGLVLEKVHRVLEFKQCKWLEPYITYNTTLRSRSRNEFETKLYKLLNNSVYGKTIEKTSTDKPIYAGFSILELSKKFMYEFHYDVMLPKYQDRINLLYIDTDGLIYEIQTADFYGDLGQDRELLSMMDTSNLSSEWGIPKRNKKSVGKMKDEYGGQIIREFFGVGAKVYFLDVDGKSVKKSCGMMKYVKEKYVTRDDYAKCVLGDSRIQRYFMETATEGHSVQTRRVYRTVLSPGDLKRLILEDKVNTRAWGFRE